MAESERLTLADVIAIDVHTHVEMSEAGGDSLPDELRDAAIRHFRGESARPTAAELARYYRERRMMAVVFTVDSESFTGQTRVPNEEIAEVARANSDVLIPFASIDPHKGRRGVDEARRLIAEHGVRGFKFHPNVQAFFPNDRLAYPLYELIEAAGLPALFHSGHSGVGSGLPGGGGIRLKYSNPMHVDDVAVDFPDLKIVLAHPSFPWQDEAISIALHKPQVYIDLSGWSPKYFPPTLIHHANTLLRDRMLFGTDYPFITPERWLADFDAARHQAGSPAADPEAERHPPARTGGHVSDKRPVVVYGASGFSARLIIEFLREYNVPFIAAGRDREKIEEVLSHVPGIGTADYEIVQVDHDVDALASLLEGAKVVCNTVGPCIYHGSTVAEAALKAGCHYIDTGGETPWVRLAHEEWGAKFADAGLLLAPATAYMSAVAEACARIAIERAPGIDSLEILSMFMGFPTYGSTQTIFGQLQWESIYLEQNEYKEWPPVTTLEVTIPSAITTQLALPWGGFPASGLVQGPSADRERARLRRPARPLDHGGHRRGPAGLPGEDQAAAAGGAEAGARRDRRLDAAGPAAAREPAPAAHGRRRRRTRQPRDGARLRARPGRLPPDGPDPGVRRTPPRAPPPRKVGFASPGEAFGHRELLGALEAYGLVRVEVG